MSRFFNSPLSAPVLVAAALMSMAAPPAHAALTWPDCPAPVAGDFREVVLVARSGTANGTTLLSVDPTLTEPVSIYVKNDGRVFWAERSLTSGSGASQTTGRVKMFNPDDNSVTTVLTLNVATGAAGGNPGGTGNANAELGLRYVTLHPNFDVNRWAYVVYTPATATTGRNVDTMRVSRFTVNPNYTFNTASEMRILSMAWSPGVCCHQGGAMDWDDQGNLYITTGNNRHNSDGYGPMDTVRLGNTGAAKDRATADNQSGTANTMDWRGKVLRIHPDSSVQGYSIPAGNLRQRFHEIGGDWVSNQDTNLILPEIYSLGHRNPYSIAVDRATGWVAVGEVGPDNGTFSATRGAVGREEYNMIRRPGFYGFPYFIGEGGANGSYNMYNPAAVSCGTTVPCNAAYNLPFQDPSQVFNNSPHTNGVTRLPPAIPATIGHARGGTQPQPALGLGLGANSGNAGHAGPIYRYQNGLNSPRQLPPHFHGKWIIYEGADDWVSVATVNDSGEVTALDPFPGSASVTGTSPLFRGSSTYGIIDMKVGPEGAIYAAGYNSGYFSSGTSTRINRVEYAGACTSQVVSVYRSPEQKRANLMQGVLFVPGTGALAWPEGMTRVEAFDLRGKRIFSATRAAGAAEVAVPQNLGSSLLRIRFSP